MNEEHVYENRKYQSVVQNLKATFFDVVYQEENKLRSLQKKMEEGLNEQEKEQLTQQIEDHRDKLDKTMNLVDDLVHSIEELDLLTKNIVAFSSKEVNDNISKVSDKDVKEAYQKDLQIATENQKNLQSAILNRVFGNPMFDSANKEIEQGVKDIVNNEVVSVENEASVEEAVVESVPEESGAVEEPVIVPEIEQPSVEGEAVIIPEQEQTSVDEAVIVPEVTGPVLEIPTINPEVEVPVVETVENAENKIIESDNSLEPSVDGEEPVVNSEFVLSPIDDGITIPDGSQSDISDANAISDVVLEAGVDSMDKQLVSINEVQQDIENNPFLTEEEKNEEVQKFKRITNGVIKAILVTKKQYEKLSASKEMQKTLVYAKESIGDNPLAINTIPSIDASIQNEQVEEQTLINNGLLVSSNDDKQKELEGLMEQANTLYKEGKTEEAQAIYNKVSEINKGMQDGNSEGVAIVKK